MWKSKLQLKDSIEKISKKSSIEIQLNKKSRFVNCLGVDERDYMIKSAIRKLNIAPEWYGAVKKGANYLSGDKFWSLVEYSRRAKNPAHYFVKAVNRELAR